MGASNKKQVDLEAFPILGIRLAFSIFDLSELWKNNLLHLI